MRSRLYAGTVSLDKQVFTTAKRQEDTDSGHPSTSDTMCLRTITSSASTTTGDSIDQVEGSFLGKGDYFSSSSSQVTSSSTSSAAGVISTGDLSFVNYEWDPCIFEGSTETSFPDTESILSTVVPIDQQVVETNSTTTTFSLLDVPTSLLTDLSDFLVSSPGGTCHL